MSFKEFISESSDKKLLKAAEKLIIKMKKAKDDNNKIIKALELNFPSLDAGEVLANFKNELVEDDSENLDEARSSNIMGLISEIKKIPSVEKLVDLWSQSDGMAALYRTKDGNAYEITIRPAAYADHPDIKQKTKGRK